MRFLFIFLIIFFTFPERSNAAVVGRLKLPTDVCFAEPCTKPQWSHDVQKQLQLNIAYQLPSERLRKDSYVEGSCSKLNTTTNITSAPHQWAKLNCSTNESSEYYQLVEIELFKDHHCARRHRVATLKFQAAVCQEYGWQLVCDAASENEIANITFVECSSKQLEMHKEARGFCETVEFLFIYFTLYMIVLSCCLIFVHIISYCVFGEKDLDFARNVLDSVHVLICFLLIGMYYNKDQLLEWCNQFSIYRIIRYYHLGDCVPVRVANLQKRGIF